MYENFYVVGVQKLKFPYVFESLIKISGLYLFNEHKN